MAKFGLLYLGGGVPENEAERAATMKAWGAWFGGLGSALRHHPVLCVTARLFKEVILR